MRTIGNVETLILKQIWKLDLKRWKLTRIDGALLTMVETRALGPDS
jgi:hypothetical protein